MINQNKQQDIAHHDIRPTHHTPQTFRGREQEPTENKTNTAKASTKTQNTHTTATKYKNRHNHKTNSMP